MRYNKFNKKTATILSGLLAVFTLALGSEKAMASPPTPVTIIFTGTVASDLGSFTAAGILDTFGNATMPTVITASTLHCNMTLMDHNNPDDTITIHMQCRMIMTAFDPATGFTGEGPGQWVIVSGTGKYANLHGAGSLTMNFGQSWTIDQDGNPLITDDWDQEILQGFVFFDNRH